MVTSVARMPGLDSPLTTIHWLFIGITDMPARARRGELVSVTQASVIVLYIRSEGLNLYHSGECFK